MHFHNCINTYEIFEAYDLLRLEDKGVYTCWGICEATFRTEEVFAYIECVVCVLNMYFLYLNNACIK